jgi:CRP-like cAMP-binding protein
LNANEFRNSILSALDPEAIKRLRLRPIKLEMIDEIAFPGSQIDRLTFVEEGMAAMMTTFEDGSQVEVATFGYESVIGLQVLMGAKLPLNRIYMQIPGFGYCCAMDDASKEFHKCGRFQDIALRSVQAQIVSTSQSAGCNAKHNIEQRLARWLLICSDRANHKPFTISHELLANMLGSTRPTVSLAAAALKKQNLIGYSRSAIRILDIAGLEATACECYRLVRDYLANSEEFDSGIPADAESSHNPGKRMSTTLNEIENCN